MLADKKERKHSTWVKQYIKDRRRYGALCFQSRYMQYFRMDGVIMDAIYNNFVCQIKLFRGVFSLNYVTISTNNKTRNKTSASTGSLAGSKRVSSTFHLSSTRTNQRTCCEPAASISTCRDWCVENRDRCSRFATRFSTKTVESVSQTRTNLSITWSQNVVENQVFDQVYSWLE